MRELGFGTPPGVRSERKVHEREEASAGGGQGQIHRLRSKLLLDNFFFFLNPNFSGVRCDICCGTTGERGCLHRCDILDSSEDAVGLPVVSFCLCMKHVISTVKSWVSSVIHRTHFAV